MQSSDKMKITMIRIIKAVAFLAILIAINTVICHYLSPSAHKSNEMWNYYYSCENADTVFLGSSVTEMIREYVVDEYTGRHTVNMGTPSQYLATSRNLLEKVASDKSIDTAILLMGFDALERDEDLTATVSNEKAYYDSKSFIEKLKGFVTGNLEYSLEKRNMSRADSINKWMSWPVNCIVYFDEIKPNLEKKQYYKDVENDANAKLLSGKVMQHDRVPMPRTHGITADVKAQAESIKAISVSESSLEILRQMGEFCNCNGIKFIVMISPHKSGYAESFGEDYTKLDALVKKQVESIGCMYLNLNELPSVTNLMTDEYFTDSEHVTHEGIDVASGIMSDILNLLMGKR